MDERELVKRLRVLARHAVRTHTADALETVEFLITGLGKITGDDFWAEEVSR